VFDSLHGAAPDNSGGAPGGPRRAMTRVEISRIEAGGDLEEAFDIRREVFCVEQGVSEAEEMDGLDDECVHYLLRLGGAAVGTARVRSLAPGSAKIERMAVLRPHRGARLGARLMRRLLGDLEEAGIGKAVLHAQLRTVPFYAGLGFATKGAPFDEAGIAHVAMERTLRAAGD